MCSVDDLPRGLTYPRFRSLYAERAPVDPSVRSRSGGVRKEVMSAAWRLYKERVVLPVMSYPMNTLLGLPSELVRKIGWKSRAAYGLLRQTCRKVRSILNADLEERWKEDVTLDEVLLHVERVVSAMRPMLGGSVLGCVVVYDDCVVKHDFSLLTGVGEGEREAFLVYRKEEYRLYLDGTRMATEETNLYDECLPYPLAAVQYVRDALRYRGRRLLVGEYQLRSIMAARTGKRDGEEKAGSLIRKQVRELVGEVQDLPETSVRDFMLLCAVGCHVGHYMEGIYDGLGVQRPSRAAMAAERVRIERSVFYVLCGPHREGY
jgi:hypothetical protein